MPKLNKKPMPDSDIFAMRGAKVKWPTLRGGYLTNEAVDKIRTWAFGVIFLEGEYHTRLNFGKSESLERAVFFEHLHKVNDSPIFLLCWVGNYHNGSIFHCAWQFPQMYHYDWEELEKAALKTYARVAAAVYAGKEKDPEVKAFLEQR